MTDPQLADENRRLRTGRKPPFADKETKMKVWFIPLSGIDATDEYAHEHIDHYVISGTLTANHAASSYGQLVIVDDNGIAYGPGDIYEGNWSGDSGTPRDRDIEAGAIYAGFSRERNQGETEETY